MATYEVKSPDGKTWEVSAPDGATQEQVLAYAKQQWAAQLKAPAASVQAGSALRDIPRQVGLTARYGIEGLGNLANMVTDPIRAAANPALQAMGLPGMAQTGTAATALADKLGLPSPQTANERAVGDATRTLAGAGGMVAGAARTAARVGPGLLKEGAALLASRPVVQGVGAATAGGAGGAVREAGGGQGEQFAAALAGGLVGGLGADGLGRAVTTGARSIKAALTPQAVELARADQQINLTLQRSGIDWSTVPERIRQSMREDVAQAMNTGQPLNADALRRLLVFRRTNTTPTVGQLTQDPGQITREMNLSKTAANSTDPSLQQLPALANSNTRTLLSALDEAGAGRAGSASETSMRGINALDGKIAGEKRNIGALYQAARDSNGRSLPLEGGTFARRANEMLDADNVGSFLPPDIVKKMNAIATGEYPLTVDVAEQLKTSIGNLQRNSSDGNMRRALGIVRKAIDEAPLQNSAKVNPGNMPAVPGSVPPSVSAGEESIRAFTEARKANRAFMQRIESNPALKAVYEGVEPDQFMARYVLGKSATAADVRALRGELPQEAVGAFRDYIVKHLRDAATNGTDDITKFSNAAYRKALGDIQDKLPAFFSREEIQSFRDIGDAAKYMQAQPAGSAVNNSASGALLLGKGADWLQSLAQKAPLGLKDTLTGTIQGMQQRQSLASRNALMMPVPQQRGVPINPLLAGAVAAPEDRRKNYRSD